MTDVGTAWVTILPEVKQFGKDLNRQVTQQAGQAGDSGGQSMGRSMGSSLLRTAGALGIGLGLGQMIGTGLQTAMDTELANIKFTQLLGSGEQAKAFITDLKDFAAATPFDFPGLQDAASRFLAVGVEADRVIPIMTTLGDATSMMGTGAEGIDRATTALTQMQQKGKVTGEEMMQLTEAEIPAWDALASSMGLSVPAAQDLVSKGLVPAEAMFQALETSSGESLSAMKGGMEQASQTLSGQWFTLKDTVSQALGAAFGVIVPILSGVVGWITGSLIPTIGSVIDWFQRWKTPILIVVGLITAFFLPMIAVVVAMTLIAVAQIIAGWIAMAAAAIVNAIIIAAQWLIAFWPVVLVVAIVIGLVAVIWYFWDEIKAALTKVWNFLKDVFTKVWDWISTIFTNVWNFIVDIWNTIYGWLKDKITAIVSFYVDKFTAIKDAIVTAFTWVKDKISSIWESITDVVRRAVDAVKGIADGIWDGIKGAINVGIRLLNNAISGFNGLIGAVNKVPGVNVPTIPKIPLLAEGGIVTRPTLAVVGEAGPEAVIPLSRYDAAGPASLDGVTVKVFIGDQELTHIVSTQVERSQTRSARELLGGVRI